MGILLFIGIPVGVTLVALARLWRGHRKGLGAGLGFAAAVMGSGVWAIFQSHASTASIGLLFLPAYAAAGAVLGYLWDTRRRSEKPLLRAAGWICLTLGLALTGRMLVGGLNERTKNQERAAAQAEYSRRFSESRAKVEALLRENPGKEASALEVEIARRPTDSSFLIPAIESGFLSPDRLAELARFKGENDLNVQLSVARSPKARPETLETIYREAQYPFYFARALAENPASPRALLDQLSEGASPDLLVKSGKTRTSGESDLTPSRALPKTVKE